ncbi:hypothetical protein NDA18_003231 [Ustilago nuda]|nr:hypothetical protein NDA18_003231 [Ustilago nuda]
MKDQISLIPDRSDSQPESEDEMDFDEDEDEDAEVPVRFGQRINLANSGETALLQVRRHSTSMQEKNVDKMAVSKSLGSISPGVVMLCGAELRVCVEEDAGQDGEDLAYWKAVKVQQTSGQSDNADQALQSFEGQVRRQPSSKAMKLEQEVATGIFAAFVGNRSPRRQAVQRTSFDAGSSKDQGSPQKRSPVSAKDGIKGLLVSKLNEGAFSVRSEVHSTIAGEEQVVEIVRHSGGRRSSLQASSREASDSTDGAVSRRTEAPLNRLERAFASPLLTNADFSHNRSQSNQTDGSRASLDKSERQGSKLEASVFAPSKKRTSSQGLDTLEGYDLSLRAVVGSEMIELATFSTESQLRNTLGLFKPRGKWTPKPLPEDGASVVPEVPPPAQVLPLAVAMRGMARAEPQVPRRGIRGGPLLRPQPPAVGCAARHHGMWQNQRAAISTEAVVQVHNNAVNNTKASLQLNDRPGSSFRTGALGSHRRSVEVARLSDETVANKKMGELSFSAIEHLDRDLVVLSLLTVMGVARV